MNVYETHPFVITKEGSNLNILQGRPASGRTTYLRKLADHYRLLKYRVLWLTGIPSAGEEAAMRELLGKAEVVLIDDAHLRDLDTAIKWAKEYPDHAFHVAI